VHLLRTLGSASLFHPTDTGEIGLDIQPKRLALLIFLARGGHGTWIRRDTLVSLFWPEADDAHARGALRQSLTALRRLLGSEVLLTRGEEEVGLTPGAVACDAGDFERACTSGPAATACALYTGDFLAGFHVDSAAPEFGQWVDGERTRLRLMAGAAAWEAAAESERRGLAGDAIAWARRGVALAPEDEVGVGRLIELLDQQGDRAGALSAFDQLQKQLASDYGSEPSPETRALIGAVRARRIAKPGGHVSVDDIPATRSVLSARVEPTRPIRFRWALLPIAAILLTSVVTIVAARKHADAAVGSADEAHLLYLRAVYLEGRRTVETFDQARLLLQKAIDLDPVYADAYVELASSYIGLSFYGGLAPQEGFTRAAAAARRALEIDPGLGRAHAMLAASQPYLDWNWAAAAREFQSGLRLDPGDANAHNLYGIQLRDLGQYADAEREMAIAVRLDPLSPHYLRQLGFVYICAERFEDAAAQAKRAIALDPRYLGGWGLLSWARARQGRYDEALDAMRAEAMASGDSAAARRLAGEHGRLGYEAEVRAVEESRLSSLMARARNDHVVAYAISLAHAKLGHLSETLAWLRRAYEEHDPGVMKLGCEPAFAPMSSNPVLLEVAQRVGLPPEALRPLSEPPPPASR